MVIHGEILQTINQPGLFAHGWPVYVYSTGLDRSPRCGGNAPGYIMVLFQPDGLHASPANLACQVLDFSPDQQHPWIY